MIEKKLTSCLSNSALISHQESTQSVQKNKEKIEARIRIQGDKPYASVEYQLTLLDQLSQFGFGQFLIAHGGINGFWTHYMLTHPKLGKKTGKNNEGQPFTPLESFLLNQAPAILATQERFQIFLSENQKSVKENATLACIPCGVMGELSYLNFENIKNIELIGIDLDAETIESAFLLCKQQKTAHFSKFYVQDAWKLNNPNKYDLISSNGLNIYETNDEKVVELYQKFHDSLKPGGKLVASFLTPPPSLTDESEWDMSQLNTEDLLKQKIIFVDILNARWQHFRTSQKTKEQLISAGFVDIQFLYDKAKIFPTVVAYKK